MEINGNSQTEISQRLFEYITNDVVTTPSQFAVKAGIDASGFHKMLKGQQKITKGTLKKISDAYGLSLDWLLTGEGEMLQSSTPVASPTTKAGEGIPLIPAEAMAGALSGEQTVLDYECERYVVPVFKGADFLIQVKGSSMYPKYSSGDIVACHRVPLSGIFFQWNKVYVLDTDQGALIKRIKPGSTPDTLLIVSDNPKYDPFELSLASIHAVALVIGVIRLE